MNDKRLKECLEVYRTTKKSLKENIKNRYDYYAAIDNYNNFKKYMNEEEFKRIIRYNKNRYYKRYRANKKLIPMLSFNNDRLVFVTMTFNEEQMKLKEETRTKKVNNWMRDHFIYAVANIDYGDKTNREHHHAVGYLFKNEKIIPALKKDGTQAKSDKGNLLYNLERQNYKEIMNAKEDIFEPDICKVEFDDEDIKHKKLSNYLVKRLNDHTNKVSTRNRRLRVLY